MDRYVEIFFFIYIHNVKIPGLSNLLNIFYGYISEKNVT